MSDLRKLVLDLDRGDETSSPLIPLQRGILEYADLLGKEYKHNGRGPDHYDCWGLCMEVYKRLGLDLPEFLPQSQDPACIHAIVQDACPPLEGGGGRNFIEIQKPVPYCLVSFMVRPPYVTHIGVVLEDTNKFIHLLRRSRVTVERLDLWSKRVKGFYLYSPPLEGEQGGGNGPG